MPQCKHSLWLIEYRGFSTAVKSHDRMLIKTKTTRTVMLIMKKIGRMLMTMKKLAKIMMKKIGRMLMTEDWKDADDSFLLCEQSAPSYPAWHSQCPITHSPFPERDNDDEDCYDDDDALAVAHHTLPIS